MQLFQPLRRTTLCPVLLPEPGATRPVADARACSTLQPSVCLPVGMLQVPGIVPPAVFLDTNIHLLVAIARCVLGVHHARAN
jgi:hypothetical protein